MSDDLRVELTDEVRAKWRAEVTTGQRRHFHPDHVLTMLDRIDALTAERDRLREALEQAQPWLHYMLHHIAPDWSSSEAEVLRQDVALVDTRLADSEEAPSVSPCSCGGSGKRYPALATFDDPCPDCREVSP